MNDQHLLSDEDLLAICNFTCTEDAALLHYPNDLRYIDSGKHDAENDCHRSSRTIPFHKFS